MRRSDPGWSRSGTGAPIANRGGVAGAWLADLLLYLFGLSAWWWVVGGVVLVVAGYRRVVHPERHERSSVALAAFGFALVLLSSAALEAHAPVATAGRAAADARAARSAM